MMILPHSVNQNAPYGRNIVQVHPDAAAAVNAEVNTISLSQRHIGCQVLFKLDSYAVSRISEICEECRYALPH